LTQEAQADASARHRIAPMLSFFYRCERRLEPFLKGLPKGFQFAIEIRNQDYFQPD
jgi:hypothetical protein